MIIAEDLWIKINDKNKLKEEDEDNRDSMDEAEEEDTEGWDSMEEEEEEDWYEEMESMSKVEQLKAILNRLKELK